MAWPALAASAAPAVCTAGVVHQTLIAAGKLTQQDIDEFGVKVDLLRCGDVTNDGASDALFTLASGGTAGDTVFGVVRGNPDGTAGGLALYKQAYKVGVARHSRRSFDVIQPHYGKNDAELLPELVPPAPLHVDRHALQGRQGQEGQERAAALLSPVT